MNRPIVEICVASVADSLSAESCGADRLELNGGLQLGGLTPSAALVQRVLRECNLPVVAMVRPRPGGFCYRPDDWQTLLAEANWMVESGIHGLAFGVLTADREVDLEKVNQLRRQHPQTELVFHRAFDLVANWKKAIDQLVGCGVKRLMTSGMAESVPEGVERIAEIVAYSKERIEIIPAGGINDKNVVQVVSRTGCNQVHGTFSSENDDPGYLDAPIRFAPNDALRCVDRDKVVAVIANLESASADGNARQNTGQ